MTSPTPLSKLERVDLREAWKHEANDFTPWLAEEENLQTLAEALGISELELVDMEYSIGDFKLDILCSEGDQQVVIENQLEPTDHRHLGQILAYAAGVDAKKVIWVAESFRPEHLAALDYLNVNTIDDFSFFAVQIELWRIGDSPLAPKFEVVAKPNDWARAGREQARAASSSSPTKTLQHRFWTALVERLANEGPQIKPAKPGARHWLFTSIGRSGFALTATVNTKDQRLGVEIYLSGGDAKHRFAALLSDKESIESKLGFHMDWMELPGKTASKIISVYGDASIEDENRWNEYQVWMIKRLVSMEKVFRPIVKTLP
ncbi:MAG: DUF4268 domain-containing protein [Synechococcus sp.]